MVFFVLVCIDQHREMLAYTHAYIHTHPLPLTHHALTNYSSIKQPTYECSDSLECYIRQ